MADQPTHQPVEVSGDPVEEGERISGWKPWCCRECGLIPRSEVDCIGGDYDYRHIYGHEEGDEPEAFTIDLSGWQVADPCPRCGWERGTNDGCCNPGTRTEETCL